MSKQGVKVALQNQHTFVMDRPRHLDFAFDVKQTLLTRIGTCGDPYRKSEFIITLVNHGEAVELRNFLTSDVYQAITLANTGLQALFG